MAVVTAILGAIVVRQNIDVVERGARGDCGVELPKSQRVSQLCTSTIEIGIQTLGATAPGASSLRKGAAEANWLAARSTKRAEW